MVEKSASGVSDSSVCLDPCVQMDCNGRSVYSLNLFDGSAVRYAIALEMRKKNKICDQGNFLCFLCLMFAGGWVRNFGQ